MRDYEFTAMSDHCAEYHANVQHQRDELARLRGQR